MVIGTARVQYHLPFAHSLKEKRGIVKSMIARIRGRFDVSIAEVDHHNLWQRTALGIAYVTNDVRHADEVINKIGDMLPGLSPDAEFLDIETEVIHAF